MSDTQTTIDPCPLCSKRAELSHRLGEGWWQVICLTCGCRTGETKHARPEQVIARWNKREGVARSPGDALGPSELIRIELRQAMLDCWNAICADTDCHPLDIEHQGRKLFFSPNHWADMIAAELASRLSHHASLRDLVSSGGLPEAMKP